MTGVQTCALPIFIILSTIAHRDQLLKWVKYLYVLVEDKYSKTKLIYQFYKDDSHNPRHYNIDNKTKALCNDKMSGKDTSYRIDIYSGKKKELTIKFDTETERNKWICYLNKY